MSSSTRKRKSLGSSEEKGRGNIGKKIPKDQKTNIDGASPCCISHRFDPTEIPRVRSALLKWYDANKRELPWRTIAQTETRPDVRGYSVWVSGLITKTFFVRISFGKKSFICHKINRFKTLNKKNSPSLMILGYKKLADYTT